MKANELMIGDWVTSKKWRENPFKLSRINDNGKYYYGITSDGTQVGPFLLEEIEPIPLTPEIVEDRSCPQVSIYWDDRKTEETGENWYEVMIHTESCVSMLNIRYVHELQHALRLYGIDKEVVL